MASHEEERGRQHGESRFSQCSPLESSRYFRCENGKREKKTKFWAVSESGMPSLDGVPLSPFRSRAFSGFDATLRFREVTIEIIANTIRLQGCPFQVASVRRMYKGGIRSIL